MGTLKEEFEDRDRALHEQYVQRAKEDILGWPVKDLRKFADDPEEFDNWIDGIAKLVVSVEARENNQ